MSAEVLFRWKDCEENLKLARFVVRLLAEHHGRLAQVGLLKTDSSSVTGDK